MIHVIQTSPTSFYVAASPTYSDSVWQPLVNNLCRFGMNFPENPILYPQDSQPIIDGGKALTSGNCTDKSWKSYTKRITKHLHSKNLHNFLPDSNSILKLFRFHN